MYFVIFFFLLKTLIASICCHILKRSIQVEERTGISCYFFFFMSRLDLNLVYNLPTYIVCLMLFEKN